LKTTNSNTRLQPGEKRHKYEPSRFNGFSDHSRKIGQNQSRQVNPSQGKSKLKYFSHSKRLNLGKETVKFLAVPNQNSPTTRVDKARSPRTSLGEIAPNRTKSHQNFLKTSVLTPGFSPVKNGTNVNPAVSTAFHPFVPSAFLCGSLGPLR
jgi:hypothetical protein